MTSAGGGRLEKLAKEGLDLDRLRPGQREAARAAIAGRDVLAVMPTGYGKSAVYKLAAAAIEGCTVVVSPLVALQHDQVEGLADERVGAAAQVNAGVGDRARRDTFDRLASGGLEFVFLAPEQLARSDTIDALRAAHPSVFVVDEAHCISTWGHDFRPDYQRLGDVIDALDHPVVIALTATAAPPVRNEMIERLHLRDPAVVVHGFDRPNIRLSVEPFADADGKDAAVVDRVRVLAAGDRSGIVYAGTRKRAELLALAIDSEHSRAGVYHAGLSRRARDDVHRRFVEGDLAVTVATTAFGMGIDKPDVRFVVHADIAESVEAYYQEIGRSGRDGDNADAVLFYRPEDLSLRRFLGSGGSVTGAQAVEVLGAIASNGTAATFDDLLTDVSVGRRKLAQVVNTLADLGAVQQDVDGSVTAIDTADIAAIASAVDASEARRKELDASRIEMMRSYAETRGCRGRFLLTYFGEDFDGMCGHCDNCEGQSSAAYLETVVDCPYDPGMRVEHQEWGHGQVIRAERDTLVVLFDERGYRNLSIAAVLDGGLLEIVP